MNLYGIIGFSLGHSFSQRYFTEKFRREGLEGYAYHSFELPVIEHLPSLLDSEPSLCGFNVTIPWKVKVMKYLDEVDHDAALIGAVNTVAVKWHNGRRWLKGYNTDEPAFRMTLQEHLVRTPGTALVLGTGGAARSIRYALEKLSVRAIPVSRKPVEGGYSYDTLPAEVVRKAGVIVNATPLGMSPDTDSMPPVDYDSLHEGQLLYDLVYNPPVTRFLERGAEQGCITVNGLAMLHRQAELAWEIWQDA